MTTANLDHLLDLVDIRLDAFGVCEIGCEYSLECDPNDSVVVHFVLKGEGVLDCEHGRFGLTAGSVVLVPRHLRKSLAGIGPVKHERHAGAACALEDGLVSFRAVDGAADLVLGCAILSASLGGELPLFAHLKKPSVQRSRDEAIPALFAIMLGELSAPRVGTRAFVSALMKQIIVVLLRADSGEEPSIVLPTMNPRLAGVLAAVLSRPQDHYTVDSLAASAGMSRSRFAHHFSAACLCSPKEFVQSARLSSAAKLLKGSDMPVKSVAASVGYASRSHFSRAFQAKYGLDPSAFRRTPVDERQ
jgi:AraC-like DNA-binding protein